MKKAEKILAVDDLAARLKEAKALVLADYRGLTVAQISELRIQVKKAGGELMVVKNTLLTRALEAANLPVPLESLTGPTALAISMQDEVAPIKAINDYIKANSLPSFKQGVFEKSILSPEDVKKLADLPSKNELIAKLVGQLSSSTYRLVNVLVGNQQKLVYILQSIQNKGGEK